MQEQYARMQDELQNKRVTGTSGNGLVSVTLDGNRNMKEVKIKPECVDPEDLEGLEDLICAAFAEAAKQLDDTSGDGDFSSMLSNLPLGM